MYSLEKAYLNFEADEYSEEGSEISFGNDILKVIHTPRHFPGSICLLSGQNIFAGDTVFLNGCGRVDLLGGDEQGLEKSLLRLSGIVKPEMYIYSGHGDYFLNKK